MPEEDVILFEQRYREKFGDLAQDLFIAFTKNAQGVTFETAQQNAGRKDQIGFYWLTLADIITRATNDERSKDELLKLLATFRSRDLTSPLPTIYR